MLTDNSLGKQVIVNRVVEEYIAQLFEAGELGGTLHLSCGQEAVDVGIVSACREVYPEAMIFSTHRAHGQYLAATGNDVTGLLHQIREGNSQHLFAENRLLTHGIQGAIYSVAAGFAYATGRRCLCFLGDGTLAQGNLYESMNLVSTFRLPVTFVIVDNQYSMSATPPRINTNHAFANSLANAFGFGYIGFTRSQSTQVDTIYRRVCNHFESITTKPSIIYTQPVRLCGHSCNDTQTYRRRGEYENSDYDPTMQLGCSEFEINQIKEEVYGGIVHAQSAD